MCPNKVSEALEHHGLREKLKIKENILKISIKIPLTIFITSIFIAGCFYKGGAITDQVPCSNPKYTLNDDDSTYLQTDLKGNLEELYHYHSYYAGLDGYTIKVTKEQPISNNYNILWKSCGGNDVYDLATLLLSGSGYVSSFDSSAKSDIVLNKEWCLDENITVLAGSFETEHCRYLSDDHIYNYETYRLITTSSEERPLGGVIYYVGYENGVENYKIELKSWEER